MQMTEGGKISLVPFNEDDTMKIKKQQYNANMVSHTALELKSILGFMVAFYKDKLVRSKACPTFTWFLFPKKQQNME